MPAVNSQRKEEGDTQVDTIAGGEKWGDEDRTIDCERVESSRIESERDIGVERPQRW